MPTLVNGYGKDVVKARPSRKKRRCYMPKQKDKSPRNEAEVLQKLSDWCEDSHPRVEVQKCEYEKLIEKTGKKRLLL